MAKKKKKKRLGSRLLQWGPTRVCVEIFLWVLRFELTVFGHRWAYFWARVYAAIGWLLLKRLRQVALRNVDLCFPDMPLAERDRIARESFKHNVYSFFDYLMVPRYFKPGKPSPYFHGTPDDHPFFAWYKADEPGFNMTAHIGNFDICSFNIGQDPDHVPLMLITKEVKPPLLDRWILNSRQALGNEVVHADEGGKVYLRAIKQNRKCGTIVDQNGGDFAPVETFFGVPCTWQADWIRLVTKRGVRLCYHACVRNGDRFDFNYLEPEFHDYEKDTDPAEIIRDYRDWVERIVREHPEQYMWVHRRFKARKDGWPNRYKNLNERLTAQVRAGMLDVPGFRPAAADA
jgi:KDO2-lipid IV(A) lauroyltransferase